MIAVSYKRISDEGVVYIPCSSSFEAKSKADRYFKKGFLNVKVVDFHEKIIHVPNPDDLKAH